MGMDRRGFLGRVTGTGAAAWAGLKWSAPPIDPAAPPPKAPLYGHDTVLQTEEGGVWHDVAELKTIHPPRNWISFWLNETEFEAIDISCQIDREWLRDDLGAVVAPGLRRDTLNVCVREWIGCHDVLVDAMSGEPVRIGFSLGRTRYDATAHLVSVNRSIQLGGVIETEMEFRLNRDMAIRTT